MRADTRIVQGRGWNSTSSTVGVPRYGFRDTDFTMARAAGASAFVDIFLSLVAYAKHKLDSLWSILKASLGPPRGACSWVPLRKNTGCRQERNQGVDRIPPR